ncbi:hypothetical protein [Clostridium perfringens]|uniref:hypothetical protein n=1 Tax=Clostridium perfringens TaxID=1502 RepID=UPI0039EA2A3E
MGLVIVVIMFFVICFFINRNTDKDIAKRKKEEKENYKKQGLDLVNSYWIKLYSGFREYGIKEDVKLMLFKDRIIFKIDYEVKKEILFRDIEDYRIQTESQLIERASLMKVACFGVFGLGMKGKEKELNKEYVYIKAVYEGEVANIIFERGIGENEKIIQELHRLIKEYKNMDISNNVITE